jgi:phage FluMu protein Com
VVGNTLEHTDIGNGILSRIEKSQYLRERTNKWDCIKLNSFCSAKETTTRLKRQDKEWEKIFTNYI